MKTKSGSLHRCLSVFGSLHLAGRFGSSVVFKTLGCGTEAMIVQKNLVISCFPKWCRSSMCWQVPLACAGKCSFNCMLFVSNEVSILN